MVAGMTEIISREEAIARRLNRYFTGEPCVNGHIAQRYIHGSMSHGTCCECHKERKQKWLKTHPEYEKERLKQKNRVWRKNNPDRVREFKKQSRQRQFEIDPERFRAKERAKKARYFLRHPDAKKEKNRRGTKRIKLKQQIIFSILMAHKPNPNRIAPTRSKEQIQKRKDQQELWRRENRSRVKELRQKHKQRVREAYHAFRKMEQDL
jgi:hypothetical protein